MTAARLARYRTPWRPFRRPQRRCKRLPALDAYQVRNRCSQCNDPTSPRVLAAHMGVCRRGSTSAERRRRNAARLAHMIVPSKTDRAQSIRSRYIDAYVEHAPGGQS